MKVNKKISKHTNHHGKCRSTKCPEKPSRLKRFTKRMMLSTFAIMVAYLIGSIAWDKLMPVIFPISYASSEVNPVLAATIDGTIKDYKAMRIAEADEWRDVPAVLKRIAYAESRDSQYCNATLINMGLCAKSEEGQVLVNATRDVGRYAINMDWQGKFCSDRGFNIFDEKHNEKCALALYNQYGTKPWEASAKYWNK